MGRIAKLIKGEVDGVERAAELKTMTGKHLRRPLCHLYPLECREDTIEQVIADAVAPKEDVQHQSNNCRNVPQRKSAIVARNRIQKDAI